VDLEPQKKNGATLKMISNGFGVPNPEILSPDFATGFGIYKSRGIGIPVVTSPNHYLANPVPAFRWYVTGTPCDRLLMFNLVAPAYI
jgi:hypothetical protein